MRSEAIGGNRDRKNSRRYGNYESEEREKVVFSCPLPRRFPVLPSQLCCPSGIPAGAHPPLSLPLFFCLGLPYSTFPSLDKGQLQGHLGRDALVAILV